MRRASVVAVAIALAALSACGKKAEPVVVASASPTGSYSVKGANGETAQIATGSAAAAKLPSYVPLYPGAVVDSSVTGGSGTSGGGTVTFHTAAKPDEVVAFYKQRAAASGLSAAFSSQAGDGMMFSAGKESGDEGIQVIATPANGSTAVQIFWTEPSKN